MPKMRAKMKITNVQQNHVEGADPCDVLIFAAVYKDRYDESGSDEDNTFSKFTPSADMTMVIQNPDLIGRFGVGQTFYVDFTETDDA